MKIKPMTEEEMAQLPFPDTARKIGGVLQIEVDPEDALENNANVEELRRLWREQFSGKEEAFRKPLIGDKDE